MPAFVNNKFGAVGSKLAEGTMVCSFSRKKSKNDCLISDAFMIKWSGAEPRRSAKSGGGSSRSWNDALRLDLRPGMVASEINRRRRVGWAADDPNFVSLANNRLGPFRHVLLDILSIQQLALLQILL